QSLCTMKSPIFPNFSAGLEAQVSNSGNCAGNVTFSIVSPAMPGLPLWQPMQHPKPHLAAHNPDFEELLTKRELAARLKKTPRCIEQWMRKRYLPYIKISHTVLFRWKDVVEALEQMTIR